MVRCQKFGLLSNFIVLNFYLFALSGGGKRQFILRQQKGKAEKFSSLKEKIKKERGVPKNEGRNFLLCLPQGDRRRWDRFLPVKVEILAQKKFALRSAIATNINISFF